MSAPESKAESATGKKRPAVVLRDKGTITIPLDIREQLKLDPGDALLITIEGGRIVLHPAALVPRELAWLGEAVAEDQTDVPHLHLDGIDTAQLAKGIMEDELERLAEANEAAADLCASLGQMEPGLPAPTASGYPADGKDEDEEQRARIIAANQGDPDVPALLRHAAEQNRAMLDRLDNAPKSGQSGPLLTGREQSLPFTEGES